MKYTITITDVKKIIIKNSVKRAQNLKMHGNMISNDIHTYIVYLLIHSCSNVNILEHVSSHIKSFIIRIYKVKFQDFVLIKNSTVTFAQQSCSKYIFPLIDSV